MGVINTKYQADMLSRGQGPQPFRFAALSIFTAHFAKKPLIEAFFHVSAAARGARAAQQLPAPCWP